MAFNYLSSSINVDNQEKLWELGSQYPQDGMSSEFPTGHVPLSYMAPFSLQQQVMIPYNTFPTMLPWQAAPALYANTDCCTALGATPTITQDGTSLFCTFPTTEPVPPLSPAATTYAAPYYGSAWPCDDTSNTSIIASSSSTTSTSPSPIMYPATPPPTTPAVPSSLLPSAPRRKKETSGAPYTCVECNKQFTRPYNLKSHMRTHTNERPFVCKHPNCTWKFARPHDLKRHELLHSGHKPHACPVCPKRFARCDALKRHWKVDAGCAQRMEAFYHLTQRKYRKRM